MVEDYFLAAGLPSAQVDTVLTSYTVSGGGRMGPSDLSSPPQVTALTATVTRAIDGIKVMDSWAAARMTVAGDVDWESVFWPPVDASLIAQATAFARSMQDPAIHAAFIAQLPQKVRQERGVVIHHTRPGQHYWSFPRSAAVGSVTC